MASINQLISEIAHSVQGADSVPVRRAIKLGIIHARNELIRHSYEQHGYVDKSLKQRFRFTLIDVNDGDLNGTANLALNKVKRTAQKVTKPTRLTNNLPFSSVRTAGSTNPVEIPYVTEAVAHYYNSLPGMCPVVSYDYVNGFIYVMVQNASEYKSLGSIIVEAAFQNPTEYPIEYFDDDKKVDAREVLTDDDEMVIEEDMVGNIIKLVLEKYNPNIVRQTDEVPNPNLVK